MGIRVLVCGGRKFHDRDMLFREMDRIASERGPIDQVICGGMSGADTLAASWSSKNIKNQAAIFQVSKDEWNDIHAPGAIVKVGEGGRRYNAAAGPRRNQRMLIEGKPDLVVEFPGGSGTADMVRRAKRAGVEVITIKRRM